MTARKIIGILVCLIGILIGAALSVMFIGIMIAFWGSTENRGNEGNVVLGICAAFGALIGYAVYKLGRKIAR